MCAGILFVLGLVFLISDLTGWEFWGIQWYTVLFLLWGFGGIAMNHCPDCRAIMERRPMEGKKR